MHYANLSRLRSRPAQAAAVYCQPHLQHNERPRHSTDQASGRVAICAETIVFYVNISSARVAPSATQKSCRRCNVLRVNKGEPTQHRQCRCLLAYAHIHWLMWAMSATQRKPQHPSELRLKTTRSTNTVQPGQKDKGNIRACTVCALQRRRARRSGGGSYLSCLTTVSERRPPGGTSPPSCGNPGVPQPLCGPNARSRAQTYRARAGAAPQFPSSSTGRPPELRAAPHAGALLRALLHRRGRSWPPSFESVVPQEPCARAAAPTVAQKA